MHAAQEPAIGPAEGRTRWLCPPRGFHVRNSAWEKLGPDPL